MDLFRLFITSLMPVLKVLLVVAVGLILSTERVDLLGVDARRHLNYMIFYVFFPALIGCSLANSINIEDLFALWFMPFNIFISCTLGVAFGWILAKITSTPRHLHGLVIACSSAANLGNMLLIILPALCEEKSSPFAQASSCSSHAKAYASLSLAIQAIYVWSILYFIMGMSAKHAVKEIDSNDPKSLIQTSASSNCSSADGVHKIDMPQTDTNKGKEEISTPGKVKRSLMMVARSKSLKMIFAPTTIAAMVGFIIGIAAPIRKILIGNSAPLRVIYSSAELIGEAGIPCLTLIVGANLLKGLRGSEVGPALIIGILVIRNILLPVSGILVVEVAKYRGLVNSDPFYQFTLMLQYAIPPAMNIGTISQMLGTGEKEFSVLTFWNYIVAAFSLMLWIACYMWLAT